MNKLQNRRRRKKVKNCLQYLRANLSFMKISWGFDFATGAVNILMLFIFMKINFLNIKENSFISIA